MKGFGEGDDEVKVSWGEGGGGFKVSWSEEVFSRFQKERYLNEKED